MNARPRTLLQMLLIAAPLAVGARYAFAQEWSPWPNLYPAIACMDGWSGCVVGGAPHGVGTAKDSAQRPIAANARIGWFDLQPTGSLSPFVGLSAYSGPAGQVAAAPAPEPPATPEPVATPEPLPTPEATVAKVEPNERPGRDPGGDAAVDARPPDRTPERTVDRTPERTPEPTPTSVRPTPAPTPTPVAVATPTSVRPTPTPTPAATATATALRPNPTATMVAPADNSCDDLAALEPTALMGQLTSGQAKCLEGRIASESAQTTRDKVSRLLINNAYAKGDKGEWERLMKRHLEDIDRSDPDLCYSYALQLSRGGVGRAQGVIRWADYALENKSKWTGNTYKTRVYALLKMKAEAATRLWEEASKAYTSSRSNEDEAKAEKYRGMAKEYAREWLDYAKASGQDTSKAMALCVSAAGQEAFCAG